jgi:ferredoxin
VSGHFRLTIDDARQPARSRVIAVDPSRTLLTQLQRAGFDVPEACRNGNCERCFARLISGRASAARDANSVPLCISRALEDIELVLPIVPDWQLYACQLLEHTNARVQLKLPAGKTSVQHSHFALISPHWAAPATLVNQQCRILTLHAQLALPHTLSAHDVVHLLCVRQTTAGKHRLLFGQHSLLTGFSKTLLRKIYKSLLQSNIITHISA